jgi:hypothetical protein
MDGCPRFTYPVACQVTTDLDRERRLGHRSELSPAHHPDAHFCGPVTRRFWVCHDLDLRDCGCFTTPSGQISDQRSVAFQTRYRMYVQSTFDGPVAYRDT